MNSFPPVMNKNKMCQYETFLKGETSHREECILRTMEGVIYMTANKIEGYIFSG
jgi:hypothetical protein